MGKLAKRGCHGWQPLGEVRMLPFDFHASRLAPYGIGSYLAGFLVAADAYIVCLAFLNPGRKGLADFAVSRYLYRFGAFEFLAGRILDLVSAGLGVAAPFEADLAFLGIGGAADLVGAQAENALDGRVAAFYAAFVSAYPILVFCAVFVGLCVCPGSGGSLGNLLGGLPAAIPSFALEVIAVYAGYLFPADFDALANV